ncbi:MAG: DUF2277 domain-containing protein [Spirochaetia bacterium]
MCRNIKPLYNFDPPATEAEIQGAALQFVRKISGFTKPSKVNEPAFERAVDGVATAVRILLISLATSAVPHNREIEAARARARALRRYTSGNANNAAPREISGLPPARDIP